MLPVRYSEVFSALIFIEVCMDITVSTFSLLG